MHPSSYLLFLIWLYRLNANRHHKTLFAVFLELTHCLLYSHVHSFLNHLFCHHAPVACSEKTTAIFQFTSKSEGKGCWCIAHICLSFRIRLSSTAVNKLPS